MNAVLGSSANSRGAIVSYKRKYVFWILADLHRKSVVRLTYCRDMTIAFSLFSSRQLDNSDFHAFGIYCIDLNVDYCLYFDIRLHWRSFCAALNMSRDMRFPTMWYVRPAKAQTSLRIRAV